MEIDGFESVSRDKVDAGDRVRLDLSGAFAKWYGRKVTFDSNQPSFSGSRFRESIFIVNDASASGDFSINGNDEGVSG